MDRFVLLAVFRTGISIAAVLLPIGRGPIASAEDRHDGGELHHLAGLLGLKLPDQPAPAVATRGVSVLAAEQGWAVPTKNLSCHTRTPLKIGERVYQRGVGTHANGRFLLKLHEPFVRLKAEVGVDNNSDTAGTKGTVVFRVLVDGQEKAKTGVLRGGQPAQSIDVDAKGAGMVDIRIEDGGDGYSYDQADLAEIALVRADGSALYLEDALTSGASVHVFLPESGLPFRFKYGDRASGDLLGAGASKDTTEQAGEVIRFERRWTFPDGVVCVLEGRVFERLEAAEYRLVFENTSGSPSAILEELDSLVIGCNARGRQPELITCRGGLDDVRGPQLGFVLQRMQLNQESRPAVLTVKGGRSSNGDLPLFQVHDASGEKGIYVGIGWSGQWVAEVCSDQRSGQFSLRAAMPDVHLHIPPGERIITPRILVGSYQGGERVGGNNLRRILYEHFTPLLEGRKPLPPISFNHWFTMDNRISESRLMATAKATAGLGLEYFVVDAGWFEGEFPKGVGNWTIDTTKFPNGLKPLSEYVRSLGMKFGLWFEPERADAGTRITREHPEWVKGNLVWLGRKEAQDWIIDMMDRYLTENTIEWIRYDFNTDPLEVWNALDTPETRGLSQIRHMIGLYRVLDELMRRHPTLLIEGCASGGRRIDLETIARSHTFWKSDHTGEIPVLRFHVTGGNMFLPGSFLNVNLLMATEPYGYHSLFGGPLGFGIKFAELSAGQLEGVKQHIAQYRKIRRYLVKDYYPLFEQDLGERTWAGWQFHDSEDGSGVVILIRPPQCPYYGADAALREVDASRTYRITDLATGKSIEKTGTELTDGIRADLMKAGASLVWSYEPKK